MDNTCFLRVAVALLLTTVSALALTVPVAEDTYSNAANVISPRTGPAPALTVTANNKAFLRFDLFNPAVVPPAITANNIVSATLRLYVTSVIKPADLSVFTVSSAWTETPSTPVAAPTVGGLTAVIPAAELRRKHFVSVDVKSAVTAALSGGGNDFGFALATTSATMRLGIASKEGPATGYAAELEITTAPVVEENLRIVRGVVSGGGGLLVGSGFTPSKGAAGSGFYTITFNTPFSGPPTVTATADLDGRVISTVGVTASAANFQISIAGTGAHTDAAFHVIAIGPR